MMLNEQKELCYSLLEKLVDSKLKLLEAEKKKEEWEAQQEIAAAFSGDLKNEMQRKAHVLDKRYRPNSPWTEMHDVVQEWKLKVYQLEREYRIESLMLSALCQGISNKEMVGED